MIKCAVPAYLLLLLLLWVQPRFPGSNNHGSATTCTATHEGASYLSGTTMGASAAAAAAAASGGGDPSVVATTANSIGRSFLITSADVPYEDLWELREDARDMFYHAYDSYMEHGYPWDELRPLTCTGRRWDMRERGDLDDALGGFSLTLVDSLDMLAVVGDYDEFARAVTRVINTVTFDRDVTVSVFETTIRIVGGLLSAHLLAVDAELAIMPPGAYHNELLSMAVDVATRLLPAFDTPTGIPTHRVNLRSGASASETSATCSAAAGTMVVEFGLLSRLTGLPQFESVARRAVRALWSRRSKVDLVGSGVDTQSGSWRDAHTGVGAGVDSFYEYLFKAYVLFGDAEWLDMFNTAHRAIQRHMLFGSLHLEVSRDKGRAAPHRPIVSSLQAFWPGLEVLAGRVEHAAELFDPLWQLWSHYEALPEMFDIFSSQPIRYGRDSPLRPELIETLYHLYKATNDTKYVRHAAAMLRALQRYSKVDCGYASIADVATKRLDDRMDSYFLSETTKYLFLLFDHALVPGGHAQFYNHGSPASAGNSNSSSSSSNGGGAASGGPNATEGAAAAAAGDCAAAGGCAGAALVGGWMASQQQTQQQRDLPLFHANNTLPVAELHRRLAQGGGPSGRSGSVSNTGVATWDEGRVRLARTVRTKRRHASRRSAAAMPLDCSRALFTTEGHVILLKPSLFNEAAPPHSPTTAQRRHLAKAAASLGRTGSGGGSKAAPGSHSNAMARLASAAMRLVGSSSQDSDSWQRNWATEVCPVPYDIAPRDVHHGGGETCGTPTLSRDERDHLQEAAHAVMAAKQAAKAARKAHKTATAPPRQATPVPAPAPAPAPAATATPAGTRREMVTETSPDGVTTTTTFRDVATGAGEPDAGMATGGTINFHEPVAVQYGRRVPGGEGAEEGSGFSVLGDHVALLECKDGKCALKAATPRVSVYRLASEAEAEAGRAHNSGHSGDERRDASWMHHREMEHPSREFSVAPASFGPIIDTQGIRAPLVVAVPPTACTKSLHNRVAVRHGVAVVWRGDCSFVHKVLTVQRAGAAAVLVVDAEVPRELRSSLPRDSELLQAQERGEQELPWGSVMADDGSGLGRSVTIPAVLLGAGDSRAMLHDVLGGHASRLTGTSAADAPQFSVRMFASSVPDELKVGADLVRQLLLAHVQESVPSRSSSEH